MSPLTRWLSLLAATSFAGALLVVGVGGSSATASSCTESYGGHSQGDSWHATIPLQRSFYDTQGQTSTQHCFQVSVDKHTDLQDHERITVSWSGAHVTGGRSLNPYGETGLPQEYPVVLMECRGVDPKDYPGGAVPAGAGAVSPDTCWTNTFFQRSASSSPGQGIWQQDASNTDPSRHVQGIDPSLIPDNCNVNASSDYLITPFKAADGTVYPACSAQSMPPEATVSSVSIPNEVYAFTNVDGRGSFPFEVRTALDNQSLGCSQKVACTLEVIPIDGVNCASPDPNADCNQTGMLPPGGVNPGSAPQDAVAPAFWASASNWSRRVPVPLGFSPPPNVCSVAQAGRPVPFYGSELLDQAALQWIPAYCLNKKRFNWQDNVMPDDAAFALMQGGQAAAAEVSARGQGDDGIGYAPTAATGWAVAFDIDQPGNAGQQMSIKLNALLLAKLLTESYPGSTGVGASHPGLSGNPLSLNLDPDFIKLNPGLDQAHWSESAATLLSTSTTSQVMRELTSYIAAHPRATAFLSGKVEHDGPYRMRVNPAYQGIKLPVDTWPQLDTWQYKTTPNPCLLDQGTSAPPYMPLMANPMTSMQLVAQALLYNWPNVATGCSGSGTPNDPYQLGRVAPQGVGNRFMLGLVTLGDAERYGLTTAQLQSAPGHYVAADPAGIMAALRLARPTSKLRPFRLAQSEIRRSRTAYPGSMLVYTAAKTYGLAKITAQHVVQFIRVSTSEGQVPGRGNGQLAAGYVPIKASGVTRALHLQAQKVAAAVAAQHAPPVTSPSGPTGAPPTSSGGTPAIPPVAGAPPSTSTPATGPAASQPGKATAPTTVSNAPVVKTAAVTSGWGGGLLVGLLLVGALSSVGVLAGRLALWRKGMTWAPRR